jgi:hypothetical protein
VCAGGKYDPTPSPRFSELPPRYHAGNVARLNRSDGPRLCGKDSVSTLISARRRFCDQGAPICAVSSPNRPRCALRHTAGVDFVRRSWPKPLPRPPAARPRR